MKYNTIMETPYFNMADGPTKGKSSSINRLATAAMLVLLGATFSFSSKQVIGADIAGYMEYKKKLEAQERALEGLQKVEDLAKKGDVQSQYELAMAYRYGWGIGQNNRDAALWFREAVDFGHARAQFELGLMYEFGEGVPKNLKRAHALYQQAAKQDIREARVSLALIRGKMLKVEEYIRNHHKPNYNTQE